MCKLFHIVHNFPRRVYFCIAQLINPIVIEWNERLIAAIVHRRRIENRAWLDKLFRS